MEKRYRKHNIVMILCFLVGGFSILLYLFQVYSIIWRTDMVSAIKGGQGEFPIPVFSQEWRHEGIYENASVVERRGPPETLLNETTLRTDSYGNVSELNRRGLVFANPSSLLLSPFSIALLFVGIVSLLAGLSIWGLVREKEIHSAKKKLLDVFLLPEEKNVLDNIEKNGGSLTQNEIVRNTGLSRVKIHRIIKNLEKKGLIIKQQYGMTNKIVLKK